MRFDAFAAHLETGQLVVGLFHGMLLILTATGLLLYALMRDRLFLLFAGFIGGYTLLQATLSGLAFQLFWPESTSWASRAAPVLVVVTGLFATAFIRNFLESRARLAKLDRLLPGLNAVGAAVAVVALVDVRWGIRLSATYGTVLIGASVVGSLLLAARGFRPARYFASAMSAFLIGMLIASLTYVGLLPYSNLTAQAMQIGTLLLAVMIAIAITTRIRDLQVARARAAESAQKYLTALNQELERLVRDRTKALERKNEELKELAARDSLTGLLNHLHKTSCLAYGLKGDLGHSGKKELNPSDPVTMCSHSLEQVIVVLTVSLNVGREIEQRLSQTFPLDQKQRDEHPPQSPIAV